MTEKEIKLIGEIDFKDIKVEIYNDPYTEAEITCCWQARNPSSFYTGIVYMNSKTCKIEFPKNAIIPEQTDKDREILPKFIITNVKVIDESFLHTVSTYLESQYNKRNYTVEKLAIILELENQIAEANKLKLQAVKNQKYEEAVKHRSVERDLIDQLNIEKNKK